MFWKKKKCKHCKSEENLTALGIPMGSDGYICEKCRGRFGNGRY